MRKNRIKIYHLLKKIGEKYNFDLLYFIENGFWVVLNQIVAIVATFFVSIVFVRSLPKEVYGQYQFLTSTLTLFSVFAFPGFSTSINRSVAKGFDGSYFHAIKFIKKWSFLGVPVFVVFSAWYYFNNQTDLSIVFLLAGISFTFIYNFNKWSFFLHGKQKFAIFSKMQIVFTTVLNASLIVLVLFFSKNIIAISIVYLTLNSLFSVGYHLLIRRFAENSEIDQDCISYGKYMTKIGIFRLLVTHFDKIVIGFLDIRMLAVYSVGIKLFDIAKELIKSFYSITFPKFAKHKVRIERWKILALMGVGITVTIAIYFIAEPAIVFIFKEEYREAGKLFKKLSFLIPIIFVSPLFSYKMNAEQDKKKIERVFIYTPIFVIIISSSIMLLTNDTELFIVSKIYLLQIIYFLVLVPVFNKKN